MSFATELSVFGDKNKIRSINFYRRVTIAALGGIQFSSPWDTGAFRNDWAVTVGSENGVTVSPYTVNLTGKEDIYIRNTMPYAEPLEHGHSDQAPQGVVRVVAKELKFKIEAGFYNDR